MTHYAATARRQLGLADPYEVDVVSQQASYRVNRANLAAVARFVLAAQQARPAQIEIAVVSDRRIAQVHRQYLGVGGATDVITFDLSDEDGPIIGQLVVSADTARQQAAARGHSAGAELSLYVVHGLLHLLGHDDRRPADRNRMHARQNELMEQMGFRLRGDDKPRRPR